MRMIKEKKCWMSGCLIIAVSLFLLFVTFVESWGQCTPGQRALPGVTLIYGEMPWVGDWVPKSVMPSGSGIPSDKEYAQAVLHSTVYTCGYTSWAGWGKYPASTVCPGGYMNGIYTFLVSDPECIGYDGLIRGVCYGWKDGVYSEHDYDCDGSLDSQDPNPGTPDPNAAADNGYLRATVLLEIQPM